MSLAAAALRGWPGGWGGWLVLRAALRGAELPDGGTSAAHRPSGEHDALRQRDPAAWQRLFATEADAIFRYVHARTGNPEEAEDITSQVFEEAWKHVGSFEDRGLPVRAWLFGIARNLVSSHRRRWFRRPRMLALDSLDREPSSSAIDVEGLDLARAVNGLSGTHAEVITLRFVHGLTLQETAAVLGTSVDAVKGRQARALADLRARLTGESGAAASP